MSAELPRLWMGAPTPLQWEGSDCVDAAYARGQGVIFLTPHLGCFESTAQGLAQRYSPAHGPILVLYRPARQPVMVEVLAGARERPGLETAPTTLAGVRQMIKALRAGRAWGCCPIRCLPTAWGSGRPSSVNPPTP
jgi:KDO2-lipid IV(A) lauroyltransferase